MITPTASLSKAKWWVFMWLAMLFAVAQATFRINGESERICDLSSISVPALSEFSADAEADRKLYASISVSVGALYIGRKQALRFTSGSALPGSQSYTFYGSYDNVKTALRSLTYKPNADSLQNTDALQIQVFKTEDAKASAPVLALPIAIEIYPRYKISTPAVPDGYLDIDEGNALHVPVTLTIPNVPKSSVELVSAEFEVQSGVLNLGASCQKSKLCTFDGLSLTRVAALLEGLQYVAPMGLNGIMIIDPLKIILRSKTRMYTTDMAFYLRVMPATEQLSVDVQKVILASSSQLFPVHDYIQIQGRSDINCQLTVEVNNSMLALLSISQAKFYTQYFYEPRTDLTMNKAKKSLSIFGRLGALKDMIRSLYYIPPQEQKTLVTDGLSVQLSGCIGADGMPRTEIYLDTGRIVVEYAPVPPKLSLNTSVATSLILYGHENESKNLSLVTLTHYGDYAPVTAVLVSLTAMDGGLFDISDVLAEKVLHNDVRVLNQVNGSVVLLTTLQEFNSVVPMISYVPPAHANALSRELQHLDSALPFTIEASLHDSVLQKPMDVSLGTLAFQYYLLPTNDAPVLMVPTNMSVLSILEDTTIALSGIHISDIDQLSTPQDEYRLTIRVKFGKVRVVALDNKAEDWRPFYSLLTLTGTLDSVNARLQQLTYQPRMNFHGEDILTFTLVDQGLQVKESITVNIDAVNDPPILTLEGDAGLLLQQNTNVTIHGVSVKDMDFEFSPSPNALLEVLLETQHGRMGIINDDQIRYEPVVRAMVGPSQQSNIVLFQGTYDSIHHALQSMVYTPPKNFYGVDTLTLTVSDLGYDGIVVNQTDGTVLKKYPLQDQLTMALFVNQTQPDRLYFESVDEMASSSMTQKNPYKTLEKTQKKFVPTMSTPVTATAAMVPSLFVSSFTPAILGDMVVVNAEAAMPSTKVQLAFHCEANCRFAVTNRTAMVEDCLIPSRSVMVSTLHNHSFVQLDTTVQMVSCALDYLSVTFTTVEDSEVEVTAVIKLRADEAVAKMMNPPLYVYDQSLIAYVTGRLPVSSLTHGGVWFNVSVSLPTTLDVRSTVFETVSTELTLIAKVHKTDTVTMQTERNQLPVLRNETTSLAGVITIQDNTLVPKEYTLAINVVDGTLSFVEEYPVRAPTVQWTLDQKQVVVMGTPAIIASALKYMVYHPASLAGVLVDNQGRNGSVLSFTTLTALEVDTVLRSTGYKAPSFPSARNPVTGDVVTLSLVLEWDQDDSIFAPAGACDRQFVFFVQNHDDPPSWTVSTLSPLSFGALRNEPIALGSTFQATDEDSSIVSATLSYTCERPTCTGTGEWMISALSGASVQEKTNTSLSVFGSIEKVNAFLRAVRLHFPAGTNDRVTMVGTVRDQSSVSETLTLTGRIRMDNSTLSLSRRPVALSDIVFARNVSMATLVAVDCNDCGDVQAMVGLPDEGGPGGLSWDFSSVSSAWQRVNTSHVSVAAKDVELPAQFAALRLIVDDRVSGVAVVRVTIVSPISESLPVSLFFLAPMSAMDETPPVGQPSAVEPSWAQQSTASSPSLRFSTKTTLCMEDDVDGCTLPSLSVHNLSLVENCQDGFVRLQTNYGGFGATNASAFNVVLPSLVNGSHDIDLGDVVMTLPSHFNGIWPGSIAKDHALSQFVVPVDSLDRLITVSASLFCTGQKAIATITHRVSVVPMNDAPLVEVPMWNAVRNISEGYSGRPFVGSRLADVDAVALPSWMKQRYCQRFTLSVSSSVGELEAPTASLVKAGIVVRVKRDATVGATVALQGSLSALSSVLNEMTLLIPPQEATASMASPLQTVTVTVADGGCFGFGGTQTTTKTFSFAVVASNQRRALELMAYPVDSSDDTTYVSLTSAFSVAPVNVAVNDTQVFARVSTDYNLDIALPLASNKHVVVPACVFTYAVPQVLAPAPTVHRLLMDVPWRVNVQRIVIAFPVNAKGEYAYPLQETIELTMGTDKVATSTGSDIAAVVENVYQAVNSWKALGRISVQYVPPTDATVVTSVAMDIVFHDYAGALSMIQATSSWNGTVTVTGVQVGTMQPEIQTLTLRVPTNNVNGTFVVVVTTVPFFYYLTTCTYCTPFWNATGLEVTVTEVQNATDTLRGVMRVGARVATDPTGAYRFVSSPIAVDADARTMKLALSTFSAVKTVHVQRLTCSYELACHYELVVQYDNSFHGETPSIEALLNYGGIESVFGSDLLPTSFVLQSGRPLRRFTYDLGVVTSVSTRYARVTTADAPGNLAAQLNTLLAGSGYEAVVSTSTNGDETAVKVVLQAVDVSLIEEELMYDQIPSLVIKAALPMKEETLDSEEEAVSFVVEELSAVGSTGSYDRFLLTVQRPTLPVIAEQQTGYSVVDPLGSSRDHWRGQSCLIAGDANPTFVVRRIVSGYSSLQGYLELSSESASVQVSIHSLTVQTLQAQVTELLQLSGFPRASAVVTVGKRSGTHAAAFIVDLINGTLPFLNVGTDGISVNYLRCGYPHLAGDEQQPGASSVVNVASPETSCVFPFYGGASSQANVPYSDCIPGLTTSGSGQKTCAVLLSTSNPTGSGYCADCRHPLTTDANWAFRATWTPIVSSFVLKGTVQELMTTFLPSLHAVPRRVLNNVYFGQSVKGQVRLATRLVGPTAMVQSPVSATSVVSMALSRHVTLSAQNQRDSSSGMFYTWEDTSLVLRDVFVVSEDVPSDVESYYEVHVESTIGSLTFKDAAQVFVLNSTRRELNPTATSAAAAGFSSVRVLGQRSQLNQFLRGLTYVPTTAVDLPQVESQALPLDASATLVTSELRSMFDQCAASMEGLVARDLPTTSLHVDVDVSRTEDANEDSGKSAWQWSISVRNAYWANQLLPETMIRVVADTRAAMQIGFETPSDGSPVFQLGDLVPLDLVSFVDVDGEIDDLVRPLFYVQVRCPFAKLVDADAINVSSVWSEIDFEAEPFHMSPQMLTHSHVFEGTVDDLTALVQAKRRRAGTRRLPRQDAADSH
eukprot:gene3420-2529_t